MRGDIYTRPNKHVIISFDTALPDKYRDCLLDQTFILSKLQTVIDQLKLTNEDYISFVNFGISKYSNNLNELARTIMDKNGKPMSWIPYQSLQYVLARADWLDMIQKQGIDFTSRHGSQGPYSIITGSKPYTLLSQRVETQERFACMTYLILFTDDSYNGGDDINKEFSKMAPPNLNNVEFLKTCRKVSSYYNFYYEPSFTQILSNIYENKYQIMVFNVMPASNTSLTSVVNYPANLGIRRIKGGYRMDFDFSCGDSDYLIQRFRISYKDMSGREKYVQYDRDDVESTGQHITFDIPHSDIEGDSLEIDLKGWLIQNDDVYGAVLLNPNSDDFQRLHLTTKIRLQNDVKAFGIIPIPDFVWIFNDFHSVIMLWNIIWALIIVALMIYAQRALSKKMALYIPTNNVISMNVKSSSNEQSVSDDNK